MNNITAESDRLVALGTFFEFSVKNCCPLLTTLLSGSPIIQNGKLVGAVTHVLINDPTSGYGIFIENMLNVAQKPMAGAAQKRKGNITPKFGLMLPFFDR